MSFQECIKHIEVVRSLITNEYKRPCKKHKFSIKCKRCVALETWELLTVYEQQYNK